MTDNSKWEKNPHCGQNGMRKYATVWEKKKVLSEEEQASTERFSKDMT